MATSEKRRCLACGGEMTLYRECRLCTDVSLMTPNTHDYLPVAAYLCPACRRLEWYAPLSPIEAHQQEQQTLNAIDDPTARFEYRFRDYSEEKLQKVIDGKDYLPEAKRAAKTLLYKRKSEQ